MPTDGPTDGPTTEPTSQPRPGGVGADAGEGLLLRPALGEDVPAIHEVFLRASAGEGQPPQSRPPAEVRGWAEALVVPPLQSWVAEAEGAVVGFVTLRNAWVTLLFVHPAHAGTGVGSALVELVKALHPDGFGLRVHQANHSARRFYRRRGLVELESTDGSGYHDESPDVQLAWLGSDPLAYLRRRIDEVDDEIAVLLARRVALTGAVQDHKAATGGGAGSAARDEMREAEIVARMARHVPGLERDRLARVMHAVIAESLAAWEQRRTGP